MTPFSRPNSRPTVLTIPGLDGSGPAHWQTIWEQTRSDTARVELGQWALPHRNSWISRMDQAIRTSGGPVILAAHSLGCIAVSWWGMFSSQPYGWPVAGALLVAPADVDRDDASDRIRPFAPIPRAPLPFPTLVVGSSDDPWITTDRARALAADWGGSFVDAGALGHINADSGLGAWSEGQALLESLIDPTAVSAVSPLSARPQAKPKPSPQPFDRLLDWR